MQPREEEKKAQETPLATPEGRAQIRDQIIMSDYQVRDEPRDVESLVAQGHFSEAIQQLRLEKDRADGVISYYANLTNYPDHTVLIRDARGQETASKDSYHNWAIMGLNYVHAAKKLIEAHEKKIEEAELSSILKEKAHLFLKDIKDSLDPEKDFQEFVNSLVPILQTALPELSKKDIQKQLADIRDFCNFEHDTMSVATRMSIPDQEKGKESTRDIFQIDIPMCGNMPDKLRKQYQALAEINELASMNPEKLASPYGQELLKKNNEGLSIHDIPWYKNQPPHIQYLIRHHAKHILDGRMIPTQLRKYFPGLRNTGEEFLVDATSKEVIQHHYHSGTPGHLLGDIKQNQTATTQSLAQLKNLTGAEHVLALTLLSPGNPMSDDSALVNQVENAVAENNEKFGEQFHTCNIPLNDMRHFVANRMSGAEWLYGEAWKAIGMLPAMKGKEPNPLFFELSEITGEYNKLKSGSGLTDPENRNLQLVSVITRMAHLINEAHKADDPENKKDFIALQISCQSGKDRAGLSRLKTILDALKRFINPPSDQEKSIIKAVINTQQIGLQAGLAGGTIGAAGLKNDTKRALPDSMKKYVKDLFKRTASYNKKLPKKPGKQKKHPNQTFHTVKQPEHIRVPLEDKQEEETPMITLPFTPDYFLAHADPLYKALENPITYTSETIAQTCHQEETLNDLHRSPLAISLTPVIPDPEKFFQDLNTQFEYRPNLTLRQMQDILTKFEKSNVMTNEEKRLAGMINSIIDRIPFLADKKPQEILNHLLNNSSYEFQLSESKDLAGYTKQMKAVIPELTDDEVHALFTVKNKISREEGVTQGGAVSAGAKFWGQCICHQLNIMTNAMATSLITKNPDGSFTIQSILKPSFSDMLDDDMTILEPVQRPFEYIETYTLKKNAENQWELTLHKQNSLQIHPKIWTHMLQQSHKKLQQPKFSDEDLFVFVPCLIDKDFTEKFQKNLPKVDTNLCEKLLLLIKTYHGEKENYPDHLKNLVVRINALQEQRRTIKNLNIKIKAPPKNFQVVQPSPPSRAASQQKEFEQPLVKRIKGG